MPEGTQHSIAIKTNPHPQMLSFLVNQGYGLEAASIEEVNMAVAAGCDPARLVFDSPVKTRAEIAAIAEMDGLLVNVNSLGELDRYPENFKPTLGIRVNPQVHTGAPELFDVSKNESKFGVPLEHAEAIVNAAFRYPVGALHMHSGSQMKDLDVQRGALEALKALADEINQIQPGKIHTLDIGGGLPSEFLASNARMALYGQIVKDVFHGSNYNLVTEFGQWVHAEAGFALSTIEYVIAPNRLFIHLGADFFMRDAYTKARNFPLSIWKPTGVRVEGEEMPFDIAGPLCFAGDYLANGAQLPADVQEGDVLFVDHTGANTYALWSRHCSREVPAVWAWDGENAICWSERRTIGF
ncbi:MAG: hypothetical protein RL754_158 [Bacteroidota bacterium]